VTKKEIVKQISERANLTQLKTKEIVDGTFQAIIDTLASEGRIELRKFGVFEVRQRKARKARNPRTGDTVHVKPKNVVTFQPGKEMEQKVRTAKNVIVKRKPRRHKPVGRPHATPVLIPNGVPTATPAFSTESPINGATSDSGPLKSR
jgi:integration host factor subunit beta